MPAIDEQTLKKQLRENEFAPLYFLYGNDTFLKQHYAGKIAEKVTGKRDDGFSVQRFDGKGLKISSLSDAAATLPLFGGKKCVLVCDFEIEAAAAPELDALKKLLGEPYEDCVLVFWFDSVEVLPKKSAKIRSILKILEKNGCSAELNHPDAAALVKILCDSAGKRGCRLHPTTAKHIIATCGTDLQTLFCELEKLTAFVQNGEIFTEHIDAVCTKSIDTSVFSLAKALTAGNLDSAFTILDELFAQRIEPVAILAALSGNYVDICRAKAAQSAGKRPQDIAADFGYFGTEFRLKNAAPIASRMSTRQIRRCIFCLSDADRMLKSSKTDNRVILEQTLLQLAQTIKEN